MFNSKFKGKAIGQQVIIRRLKALLMPHSQSTLQVRALLQPCHSKKQLEHQIQSKAKEENPAKLLKIAKVEQQVQNLPKNQLVRILQLAKVELNCPLI